MTNRPGTVLRAPPAYPESALPSFVHKLLRPAPLVKAQSLAFLMFEKPDLAATEEFLADFGMHRVSRTAERLLMRGSGSQPCIYVASRGARSRYIGAAFTVAGKTEPALIESTAHARRLPADLIPGGGSCVELVDPAGKLLRLVTGQQTVSPLPLRAPLHPLTNGPGMVRRVNASMGVKRDLGTVVKVVQLLRRGRLSVECLKLLGRAMARPRPWL
jgi:hypothetical protein